jgi:hypothetical protein
MGKKILPMVEVVVSKSGSCEPIIARPKGKGLAVPRIREVPAVAMVAWVMDIISGKEWSYFLPVFYLWRGLSVI